MDSRHLSLVGSGLAKGYWCNEEKTPANFLLHPHTREHLYRTGDLGRYLPDGNIEFLGREDLQVKVKDTASNWEKSKLHCLNILR